MVINEPLLPDVMVKPTIHMNALVSYTLFVNVWVFLVSREVAHGTRAVQRRRGVCMMMRA